MPLPSVLGWHLSLNQGLGREGFHIIESQGMIVVCTIPKGSGFVCIIWEKIGMYMYLCRPRSSIVSTLDGSKEKNTQPLLM